MNPQTTSAERSGFTLIELLVVIAIIGSLAALLLPALNRAKASAISAGCKSNLHQVGIALRLYVDDCEKYPPQNWADALFPKLREQTQVICCPAWRPWKVTYGYNGPTVFASVGLGLVVESGPVSETAVRVPSDMIAIGDSCELSEITGAGFGWPGCLPPNHKDRRSNMLFCDGHLESSKWIMIGTNSSWWRTTDETRARRWFRDHEPHPEILWPKN